MTGTKGMRRGTAAPLPPAERDAKLAELRGATNQKGLVVLNTGDGKGKSTAAWGMLTRAWGHGLRVGVVQFFHSGAKDGGERKAAARMGIEWASTGDGCMWAKDDLTNSKALALGGWKLAKQRITSEAYDVVVLDEFTYMLTLGWLDVDETISWLRANKPPATHLIITGRDAPERLIDYADLVTEMKLVKHPLTEQRMKAQPGIDF